MYLFFNLAQSPIYHWYKYQHWILSNLFIIMYLFVFLHSSTQFMNYFHLLSQFFTLLLYFGQNIISLRVAAISLLPLLMSCHVCFICSFSTT